MYAHNRQPEDDIKLVRWNDLNEKERAAALACHDAYEDRRRRAMALEDRLATMLAPEQVHALGVAGLFTQWDEERLAAFEALVALIPCGAD